MKNSTTFATTKLDSLKTSLGALILGNKIIAGKVISTGEKFNVVTVGTDNPKEFKNLNSFVEKFKINLG